MKWQLKTSALLFFLGSCLLPLSAQADKPDNIIANDNLGDDFFSNNNDDNAASSDDGSSFFTDTEQGLVESEQIVVPDFDSLLTTKAPADESSWFKGGLKAQLELLANVHRRSGINSNNIAKLRDIEQRLKVEAELSFEPPYPWLRAGALLEAEADNYLSGSVAVAGSDPFALTPDYALLSVGFSQLYLSISPEPVVLILGKYPLAIGSSSIINPANYLRSAGSFWNQEGFWQASAELALGLLNLRFSYLPSWQVEHSQRSNQRQTLEQLFAWLSTENSEQLFTLDLGLFLNPLNFHLIGYLAERITEQSPPYFAGATTASLALGDYFRFYTEALLGTGISGVGELTASGQQVIPANPATGTPDFSHPLVYQWQDAARDSLQLRGLFGVIFAPNGNVDLTLEYYFNSTGLNQQQRQRWQQAASEYQQYYQQDPRQEAFAATSAERIFRNFDFAQHYINLMLAWRNIDQAGNMGAILLFSSSLPDLSLFNRLTLTYDISNNFGVELGFDGYWGADDSAFGINPSWTRLKVGLSWLY